MREGRKQLVVSSTSEGRKMCLFFLLPFGKKTLGPSSISEAREKTTISLLPFGKKNIPIGFFFHLGRKTIPLRVKKVRSASRTFLDPKGLGSRTQEKTKKGR